LASHHRRILPITLFSFLDAIIFIDKQPPRGRRCHFAADAAPGYDTLTLLSIFSRRDIDFIG
jgi:hypothetical protein